MFIAAAIFPATPQAAETGVVSDISSGVTYKTQDRTANALRGLGAQWVRMTMSWSDTVEPSDGVYNATTLSNFDRAVSLARGAGYKIIVTVEDSPSWAREGSNQNSPPRNNAELAEFMAFLAGRYAGKVQAYEVWSEPNHRASWPSGPDPAGYARMLRAVAPSIRAADPAAKVIFGGLFTNDYPYLERVYAEMPDIGDYFDVMATHPYVYNGRSPETTWPEADGGLSNGTFSAYREVRATMEDHGDTKPIWLTGFGWSTTTQDGGVSWETQADYLVRAYTCLEQDPYVQVATWHSLRTESGADTWEAQRGIMTRTFTPRPAYDALRDYEPGQGDCTYDDLPEVEPEPAPEPAPEPVPAPVEEPAPSPEPQPSEDPEGGVFSSTVRSLPNLFVTRAQVRQGRLIVFATVTSGATGKIRGRANFGRGARRFTAPIDSRGVIRIDTRLRGGRRISAVRVTLVYRASRRFLGQRVVIRAARKSAHLRVLNVSAESQ